MKFVETPLLGVWVVDPELVEDERGFFARTFSRDEFVAHGLELPVQVSAVSFNHRQGTLRGLHFQRAPYDEAKLVRCTQGAIFDVAVDLRPQSPSFSRWFGVELSSGNRQMLYLPQGCAHGFQTLEDDSEVFYQLSGVYHAPSVAGVRWDDPVLGIAWPLPVSCIAPRDLEWPHFDVDNFNLL